MSEKADSYWDKIYAEQQFKFGKAPTEFLVSMLPNLQKGKALDVAMGEGRNSVYLAQHGFEVKGFDISKVAVENCNKLASETGVKLEAKCVDLDMFLFGLMEYDTIVMTFFKPPVTRYYTEMIRALKQGGTLLIESYGVPEMEGAIAKDEFYKDYYFSSNEILRHLNVRQVLKSL